MFPIDPLKHKINLVALKNLSKEQKIRKGSLLSLFFIYKLKALIIHIRGKRFKIKYLPTQLGIMYFSEILKININQNGCGKDLRRKADHVPVFSGWRRLHDRF